MNCRRVQRLLSDQFDRVLPEREARAVTAHLENCPACRLRQEEFRALGPMLREPVAPFPLPDLERRALARWRRQRETAPRFWSAFQPPMPAARWQPAATIALAALVLALGLSGARWMESRSRGMGGVPVAEGVPWAADDPAVTHGLRRGLSDHSSTSPSPSPKRHRAPVADTSGKPKAAPHPPEDRGGMPIAHAAGGERGEENGWVLPPIEGRGPAQPAGHQRPRPLTPQRRAPVADDLVALNGGIEGDRAWGELSPDAWAKIEDRVRREVQVKDDFVQIPFVRLASNSPSMRQIAEAVDQYKKEAAIVDPRLFRQVTVQLKATALSDLCDRLRAETGIDVTAGPSVADEKVTVLVRDQPLRDLMRQLARPFGYVWVRTGKVVGSQYSVVGKDGSERSQDGLPTTDYRLPATDYRYQLTQDLRSQLAEEELRNQDQHAALVALDEQIAAYRPYLDLSADELKARYQQAKGAERELLQKLMGPAWGVVQAYYRLTPQQRLALASGESLHFSVHSKDPSRELPAQWRERLLESSFLSVRNFSGLPVLAGKPNDTPLAQIPEAMPTINLRIDRSELGQLSLMTAYGVYFGGDPEAYGGYELGEPLATGRSPSVASPDNAAANHELRDQPFFQRLVSIHPQPSCPRFAKNAPRAADDEEPELNSAGGDGPEPPHVTTADVWEEVHRETGLNIVTDFYSHVYPVSPVTIERAPLFDALCRVGDTLGVRWRTEGHFLIGRSTSFFWDRLKEVPNRLLVRWQQDRREHGGLPFEDLLEMASLSDQQLGSAISGRVIEHCWGLDEWGILGKGVWRTGVAAQELRPYLRFLARLTPGQLQRAHAPGWLTFEDLSPGQQQEFARIALWGQSAATLPHMRFHFDYVPAGPYLWQPEVSKDRYQEAIKWPLVSGPTREAVLTAARRLYPPADPAQIHRSNGRFSIAFEDAAGQFRQIGESIFTKSEE